MKRGTVVIVILISCGVFFLFFSRATKTCDLVLKVPTSSMAPTIPVNSTIKVRKIVDSIERGDIVVIERNGGMYASRVIGLPGDILVLVEKGLLVNGDFFSFDDLEKVATIDRSESFSGKVSGNRNWKLANNEIFLIGDNYTNSIDSREYGPIRISAVVGKVVDIDRGSEIELYAPTNSGKRATK